MLRDAFGTLACSTNTQEYSIYAVKTLPLLWKLYDLWERWGNRALPYGAMTRRTTRLPESEVPENNGFVKRTYFSSRFSYSFHHYRDPNDDILAVNYYSLNKPLTEVSQGPQIYNLKPKMFWAVKDKEFKTETRILQTFLQRGFLFLDIKSLDWTTVKDNKKESSKRTLKVLKRESKRVTPMKPLW